MRCLDSGGCAPGSRWKRRRRQRSRHSGTRPERGARPRGARRRIPTTAARSSGDRLASRSTRSSTGSWAASISPARWNKAFLAKSSSRASISSHGDREVVMPDLRDLWVVDQGLCGGPSHSEACPGLGRCRGAGDRRSKSHIRPLLPGGGAACVRGGHPVDQVARRAGRASRELRPIPGRLARAGRVRGQSFSWSRSRDARDAWRCECHGGTRTGEPPGS